MLLTTENYFSKEADLKYMSVSQYKLFNECEAKALATINGIEEKKESDALLQGKLFEELVAGDPKLFMAQHPKIVSSTGPTNGQIKKEFQKVLKSAEKFNSQEFFRNIIEKCEKQVILTGKICDIDVKCCLDLFDKENKKIYDIKCMSDFREQWSPSEKRYIPWYYAWGYVLQLAVYREIARQNYGTDFNTHLIAATKENTPDIQALEFDNELLDIELEQFKSKIKHYDNIKKGIEKPTSCGCCDYCKANKIIIEWEKVK